MTEQSIGTARLDLVVTTDKLDAAIDSAKRSVSSMSAAAQAEYNKLNAAEKRRIDSYIKQANSISLTRQEQILFNAALKGTPTHILDELKTKLAGAQTNAQGLTKAFSGTNKSAREMQFAMRGLPAQVTDIVTSLASGQRPLMVLLQQGGQLKDMFGGIAPAARALGGAVLSLVNPITLTATAIVALGLAWKKAEDEAQAFNLAIVQSGDFAQKSAKDLEAMADRLDKTTSATQRFASDVIAQVTASGRFSGEQVETVSAAIVNMAKAVQAAGGDADQTVKDLIKTFTDLSKDPVDALLRLNETQHFLTQSTLDQVESLKKQGKEAEAANVAINAMADTINSRAPEMEGHLSSAASVWAGLKSVIAESADAAVNFFRDADGAAQAFIRNHQAAVQTLSKLQTFPLLPFGGTQSTITKSLLDNANDNDFGGVRSTVRGGGLSVVDSAEHKARKKAEEEFSRLAESNLSKREKLESEIREIRELGVKAGKSELEIEQQIANARKRFQESLPKGSKGRRSSAASSNTRGVENASDRFDDMVGRFRAELQGPLEKAEQEHLRRMREIEQAARDGKRSHEDLTAALALEGEAYAKTRQEIEQRFAAEVAGLSGPIAQATADHEAALRRIEELKQLGVATGDEYNAMLAEEAVRHQENMTAATRAADPLRALLADMQEEVSWIGKSNSERAVMIELRRANIDVMSAEGQAALRTAKDFEEEAKAKQRSIELMDEFRSGAANALTDVATGAKSAKDAMLDFFDSLIERLIQLTAEQWIEKAFGSFGTSDSGSTGLLSMFASIFGGGSSGGGSSVFNGSFAKGAAFANGAPVQYFARGDIFDQATAFPMRGGMGVMGEAGPEAIMPLKRGPDGKLGVAVNDDAPRRGDIHQTNYYTVMGSMDRRAREEQRASQSRDMNRAARRN